MGTAIFNSNTIEELDNLVNKKASIPNRIIMKVSVITTRAFPIRLIAHINDQIVHWPASVANEYSMWSQKQREANQLTVILSDQKSHARITDDIKETIGGIINEHMRNYGG